MPPFGAPTGGSGKTPEVLQPIPSSTGLRGPTESRRLDDPPGQTVVSEDDLRTLHDRLYRLEAAVQDVDADLVGRTGVQAYREALDHLMEASRDLVGLVVEPVRP